MSGLGIRLLIMMLTLVAVLGMTFKAGDNYRNNAWLAKNAKVERDAHAKYEAEVKRGDDASGAFLVEHQAMQSDFQNLTEKFNALSKHTPLVVAAAPGVRSANGCGVGAVPPEANAAANGGTDADVIPGGLLTAGAVWMWNSALTGTDQPSGACGSLDTSEAACAVATAIDLDDAWANHRANAQACALNRLAHDRLIDFLTNQEKPNEKHL
jgi:hypothetical protein